MVNILLYAYGIYAIETPKFGCRGYLCDNKTRCLSYRYVCDGYQSCHDGYDEGYCCKNN